MSFVLTVRFCATGDRENLIKRGLDFFLCKNTFLNSMKPEIQVDSQ